MELKEMEEKLARLTEQVRVLYRATNTTYWECGDCGHSFSGQPYASNSVECCYGEGICERCYGKRESSFIQWFVIEEEAEDDEKN